MAVLLDSIRGVLAAVPLQGTVLVVDDGSTDGTAEVVRGCGGRDVVLVSHARNLGLHEAVRTAMSHACEIAAPDGVLIIMDADDTHSPDLIPGMLREIAEGADVVVASRFAHGGCMIGAAPDRQLYSHAASLILRLRFPSAGARDFTCGYRAYRIDMVREAFARWGDQFISVQGFACMLQVLLRMHALRARIREVPLVLRYDRKRGPSKMRVLRTIANTLRLIARPRTV